ncbi:MAG: response regulator transcription factor [Ignavibacteriales bacterium]|jgi:two-component system invasion response regulator UvrY|nr:response regulator transcription factor [Ignavibacteriales bacterium]MBK8663340.1 response regulator transcription factor [Ignavibacteriales bacterium]MBP7543491.1 response regulator transcription factor [Ignavibacteriaceae bacterium]MBP9122014.1 response regulator transcription factor [Ignavibacteriaceae bacterium]MCC6638833.1 response regulator transcription factor [Ignavibacteriaceae bacterium]
MIKIFLADDHILIREGLKRLINIEPDIRVIGESADPVEILKATKEGDYDILILDITLPQKSGLEILKEVKAMDPSAKVLILSMHPEERFAIRSLKAGAYGYLTKESAGDDIILAIKKIASGRRYLSESLAEKLAGGLELAKNKLPHEILSDREFEILRYIAQGKALTEIGEELNISVSTVGTYRSRILDKLKLSNNAELILYVLENHLID